MDKDEIVSSAATVQSLIAALPSCDGTAKLHGKAMTIQQLSQKWKDEDVREALLAAVSALEAGVRRMHERDPLTRLANHLATWRASLEGSAGAR